MCDRIYTKYTGMKNCFKFTCICTNKALNVYTKLFVLFTSILPLAVVMRLTLPLLGTRFYLDEIRSLPVPPTVMAVGLLYESPWLVNKKLSGSPPDCFRPGWEGLSHRRRVGSPVHLCSRHPRNIC